LALKQLKEAEKNKNFSNITDLLRKCLGVDYHSFELAKRTNSNVEQKRTYGEADRQLGYLSSKNSLKYIYMKLKKK